MRQNPIDLLISSLTLISSRREVTAYADFLIRKCEVYKTFASSQFGSIQADREDELDAYLSQLHDGAAALETRCAQIRDGVSTPDIGEIRAELKDSDEYLLAFVANVILLIAPSRIEALDAIDMSTGITVQAASSHAQPKPRGVRFLMAQYWRGAVAAILAILFSLGCAGVHETWKVFCAMLLLSIFGGFVWKLAESHARSTSTIAAESTTAK